MLTKSSRQNTRHAMRPAFSPLILLSAALAVCATAQDGAAPKPEAKPAAAPPAEKVPNGPRSELSTTGPVQKLGSLPSRYQFLLTEAMRRFQVRDWKGATDYVERADEVLPPTAWSLNVRGAIAIEQHDFDRGYKYCSDALKLDANFFPAKFNICEIPFIERKYAEARSLWLKLFATIRPGDSISELVIYRICLTYLLENDFDRAKEWLEKLPFPSQTPAYQYAHAAWARQKGDIAKWDEWVRSANFIWPESKRSEFVDVLYQLGWMKRE
jgi:tetratricopeptide (TPR) repeat protein